MIYTNKNRIVAVPTIYLCHLYYFSSCHSLARHDGINVGSATIIASDILEATIADTVDSGKWVRFFLQTRKISRVETARTIFIAIHT